jgi:hypothetical protein
MNMAITKLRLQQIQDEVTDFAVGTAAFADANDVSTGTLHAVMNNLAHAMERRFGIKQDAGADIGNMLNSEHAEGVLAHHNSAAELLIKQEGLADIRVEGGKEIKVSANDHLSASSAIGDVAIASLSKNIDMYAKEIIRGTADLDVELFAIAGAGKFHADQSMEVKSLSSSVLVEAGAGARMEAKGGELRLSSSSEIWSEATTAINLSSATGYYNASFGGNADWTIGGAATMDVEGKLFLDTADEMELLAVANLSASAARIALEAGTAEIRFDDGFNTDPALDAYYSDGINLADSAGDWVAFQDAFGNKSLLKAISEAAAGSEGAARFVGTVTTAISSGTELIQNAGVTYVKYTPSSKSAAAAGSAPHALATAPATASTYSVEELDFAVDVYVNGQRLKQTEDFSITDGSNAAFADTGLNMDVKLTFALEADDVVEIVVK